MLQPFIDALIPFMPGYLELPESYVGLLKGASHKYIKRVPKAGGGYRYFYHVGHGGGVNTEDHFVTGASFRHDGGHYHIKSEDGGKLTIEHDETKDRKTVSKAELREMLTEHHAPAIKAHREKVAGMLAEARANKASSKQIAKLEARAKAAGADMNAPVPKSKSPLLQPGAVIRPRKDAYMGQQEMTVTGMDGDELLVEFPHPGGGVIKRSLPARAVERHYEVVHAAKAKPSRSDYKTKVTQSSVSKWDVEITTPDGKTKWERVGGERPIKDAAEARKVALDQFLGAEGSGDDKPTAKASDPKDGGGTKAAGVSSKAKGPPAKPKAGATRDEHLAAHRAASDHHEYESDQWINEAMNREEDTGKRATAFREKAKEHDRAFTLHNNAMSSRQYPKAGDDGSSAHSDAEKAWAATHGLTPEDGGGTKAAGVSSGGTVAEPEDHHVRIARLGVKPASEKRTEILASAHGLGVDDATFKKLAESTRINRAEEITLPSHRHETLSRGSGWATNSDIGVTLRSRESTKGSGYRVPPGKWSVGASDGYQRKGATDWSVEHVTVGPHTWTVAN